MFSGLNNYLQGNGQDNYQTKKLPEPKDPADRYKQRYSGSFYKDLKNPNNQLGEHTHKFVQNFEKVALKEGTGLAVTNGTQMAMKQGLKMMSKRAFILDTGPSDFSEYAIPELNGGNQFKTPMFEDHQKLADKNV